MFAVPSMQYTPGGYTLAGYCTLDPRSIAPVGNVTVHWKFPEIVSAIEYDGTVIVSTDVETVPPNAKTLPMMLTLFPIVTPAASSIVPANLLFVPSVVAPVGTHDTVAACALFNVIIELSTVVSAPPILKMYTPSPESVIPPAPIEAAPVVQYTPGVYTPPCTRDRSTVVPRLAVHTCEFAKDVAALCAVPAWEYVSSDM